MSDRGFTHVALAVGDLDASIAFYATYAGFAVVHERRDEGSGSRVAWISDRTRPFVIVLIDHGEQVHRLAGSNHLGVSVASREEVDRLAAKAAADGCLAFEPRDDGYPVGYWTIISDPDGHQLEISHGQEVGAAVASASAQSPEA